VIPARISLLTLGVRNLATAADFYERLGWPRRGSAENGVVLFETEGARLALYPLEALAHSVPDAPIADASSFRGAAYVIHLDGPDAVDAAEAVARAAGARIVAESHATEWGGRVCLFADPDGNLWELLGQEPRR